MTRRRSGDELGRKRWSWRLAPLTIALLGGCSGSVGSRAPAVGGSSGGGAGGGTSATAGAGGDVEPTGHTGPFEPLPPAAYLAKVKNVLTGLPPTDDELKALRADEGALRGLIDGWMKLPEFRARLLDFFAQAFQQTQIDASDLEDMFELGGLGAPGPERIRFVRAVSESFARTAIALVDEGRPFTDVATTKRFMLNVPLMAALSYLDANPRDEALGFVQSAAWPLMADPNLKYVQIALPDPTDPAATPDGGAPGPTATMIPIEQSLDPSSPNYLVFTVQTKSRGAACMDRVELKGSQALRRIFGFLLGGTVNCGGQPTSQFSDADWNSWRMVTVRAPKPGEVRTPFWALAKLRDAQTTELALTLPRVGFFTTPAFFANWPTNDSNQFRVTTNQALIAGLSRSFDDRQTTVILNEGNVDAMHVEPGTVCFACHQTLDPMRDFFAQSYSYTYFPPNIDPKKQRPLPAVATFSLEDQKVSGSGIETFGKAIAASPAFAPAWITKICTMANAAPCDEEDPEVARLAKLFTDSKYDFKTAVRETLASPLVTFAKATTSTAETGAIIAIARREAFCARLEARLGLADVCNARAESALPKTAATAKNLSFGIPGGGYARGDLHPLLPHDPNMFGIAGTEKLCALLATSLIDGGATTKWKAVNRDAAIADFASIVMGVPPADERSAPIIDVLKRHADAAVAAKASPSDALRSTFVVACSSQLATSQGL